MDSAAARMAVEAFNEIEESGVPLLDGMLGLPLEQPEDRIEQAKRVFDRSRRWAHPLHHPSANTPCCAPGGYLAGPGGWDYQAFMSEELRDYVQQSGVQVIGYRALRSRQGRARDTIDRRSLQRCPWATSPAMIPYHDAEWGVPVHDDRLLFEFLVLEGML